MTRKPVWDDASILRALHLFEVRNFSVAFIARILSRELGKPITKNAVIGIMDRVSRDYAKFPDLTTKRENRDRKMIRYVGSRT